MCVAPEVDLGAAVVIGAVGVDAIRHVERPGQIALASLPLLFAVHQAVESIVWWGAQGDVSSRLGDAAMWVYLVFALVVLPVLVPFAVTTDERDPDRRRLMAAFAIPGIVTSIVLLAQLIEGPVTVRAESLHLEYSIGLDWGVLVTSLYVAATCGPLLVSSAPRLRLFGIANLFGVLLLGYLNFGAGGIISLWCFWAAVVSVLINAYLRHSASDEVSMTQSGVDPARLRMRFPSD